MTDGDTRDAPSIVTDLADGCVRYVQEALGLELDYTQDTLPVLDHYVRMMPEQPSQDVLALMGPMCGAYFGEVVRAELEGARWHAPSDDYAGWRIEFEPCFLHFNPIGMALEALLQDDAEGWQGHLQVLDQDRGALKEALDRLGEVPEEDYYRLSVRYEVIHQAYVFLTDHNVEQDGDRRSYDHEFYDKAVRSKAQKNENVH